MSLPLNQVIVGDSAKVMREWPENSVDCIVTDPPYGISFMGADWDRALPPKEAFKQMIRVLKPGALAFVMSSPRQDVLWRMMALLEGVGFELRQSHISWIYRTGFPKSYDLSKGIDRKFGHKQKTIGKYISPRQVEWGTLRDEWPTGEYEQSKNRNTYGYFEGGPEQFAITEPITDEAKKWSGWKSQSGLKPAVEMILMVNKPRSESTIVDNVLRWGTGAINIDACRIPYKNKEDFDEAFRESRGKFSSFTPIEGLDKSRDISEYRKGRFPANLIISDSALDTGETTGGGKFVSRKRDRGESWRRLEGIKGSMGAVEAIDNYGDKGSPYRFFDIDAWATHHGFLDVAKPSRAERDMGLWTQPLSVPKSKFNLNDGSKDMRFDGVVPTPRRNVHPTTKPVKLMAYLIELGCPKGGVVVDPFLGSGTTCIAAMKLRRQWIGIEIDPEYAEMAEARINIKGPLDQYLETKDVH